MENSKYIAIEKYMLTCMKDSAHDKDHIYRVLYVALDIAQYESGIDYDVLISACMLHDIGRQEQFENPTLCHASIGGEKAYKYLLKQGWEEIKASHVKECIETHRFRNNNPPESIEAKILFDADKIDVTGTLGIARTIFFAGQVSQPLYSTDSNGLVSDGSNDISPSFFREYKFKLEKLYDGLLTNHAKEIARERQGAAVAFYENMLNEVRSSYAAGITLLRLNIS